MRQAKTTAWVGPRLIRTGELLEDTDPLTTSHPDLFQDAESAAVQHPPKVFRSDSPENPAPRPGKATPDPAPPAPVAPERKPASTPATKPPVRTAKTPGGSHGAR